MSLSPIENQPQDSSGERDPWLKTVYWLVLALLFTGLAVMAAGELRGSEELESSGLMIMAASLTLGFGLWIHLIFARRAGKLAAKNPRQLGALLIYLGLVLAYSTYSESVAGFPEKRPLIAAAVGIAIGSWLLVTGRSVQSHGEKLETWWYIGLVALAAAGVGTVYFGADYLPGLIQAIESKVIGTQ